MSGPRAPGSPLPLPRAAALAFLIPALMAPGCRRDLPEALSPEEALETTSELPSPMSPGTLRGLGPHVFEASFDRRADRQGIFGARETVARLSWAELDRYEYTEIDGGRLLRGERRLDRELYRRGSEQAPWQLFDGVPGDSTILLRSVQLWEEALGPFGDQVAIKRLEDRVVDGRPAIAWRISSAPPPSSGGEVPASPEQAADRLGRTATVLSLQGTILTDVETGNRLLAEVEGRFVPRANIGGHDPTDEVHITYRERRVLLDLPETITQPPPDLVKDRRQASRPVHFGGSGRPIPLRSGPGASERPRRPAGQR